MLTTKCSIGASPDPKIAGRQKSLCPLGVGLSWLIFPIARIRSLRLFSTFTSLISGSRLLLGSRLNSGFRIGASFLFVFVLSGCATLEVAREVQSGRLAMQLGNSEEALRHFETAAQVNPDYITDFTLLDIGIWSYVGMAQYGGGKKEKALASFKQAVERHSEDYFAKTFLGLVMSENGRRREGQERLVDGLNGLGYWLDTTRHSTRQGAFWDPGDYLAKEIGQTLKLLQAEEINWREINENVIRLARNFDEEIDEVKTDKEFEGDDDDEGDSGVP